MIGDVLLGTYVSTNQNLSDIISTMLYSKYLRAKRKKEIDDFVQGKTSNQSFSQELNQITAIQSKSKFMNRCKWYANFSINGIYNLAFKSSRKRSRQRSQRSKIRSNLQNFFNKRFRLQLKQLQNTARSPKNSQSVDLVNTKRKFLNQVTVSAMKNREKYTHHTISHEPCNVRKSYEIRPSTKNSKTKKISLKSKLVSDHEMTFYLDSEL